MILIKSKIKSLIPLITSMTEISMTFTLSVSVALNKHKEKMRFHCTLGELMNRILKIFKV